jgi:hypothetical protein
MTKAITAIGISVFFGPSPSSGILKIYDSETKYFLPQLREWETSVLLDSLERANLYHLTVAERLRLAFSDGTF